MAIGIEWEGIAVITEEYLVAKAIYLGKQSGHQKHADDTKGWSQEDRWTWERARLEFELAKSEFLLALHKWKNQKEDDE